MVVEPVTVVVEMKKAPVEVVQMAPMALAPMKVESIAQVDSIAPMKVV